jgi:hypothetical protein
MSKRKRQFYLQIMQTFCLPKKMKIPLNIRLKSYGKAAVTVSYKKSE